MDTTSRRSPSRDEYTIGWICALSVEYRTARAFLDEEHNGPRSNTNMNRYTLGSIRGHNIVIAAPPNGEYGLSSTASVTKSLLDSFPNIRFGLLVGIGGGAPSKKHNIRLGDVIVGVSSHAECGVVQYDFEKTMQSQEFHETSSNQAPGLLHTAVTILQVPRPPGHTIKDQIHSAVYDDRWPSLRRFMQHKPYGASVDGPEIHYGLIASANNPMKDASVRDELVEKRDILCFETEAAGLMNHFPCLVIRGICDYSDSQDNEEWQGYAAVMAAAYARRLLGTIPQSEVEAQQRISIALG
ncbi:purine and uridine phosphorylase [Trichoderma sp. TUCIM 5745]